MRYIEQEETSSRLILMSWVMGLRVREIEYRIAIARMGSRIGSK